MVHRHYDRQHGKLRGSESRKYEKSAAPRAAQKEAGCRGHANCMWTAALATDRFTLVLSQDRLRSGNEAAPVSPDKFVAYPGDFTQHSNSCPVVFGPAAVSPKKEHRVSISSYVKPPHS